MSTGSGENRRPVAARGSRWANELTRLLLRWGVRPNQVSLASIFFAELAAIFLLVGPAAEGAAARICFLSAALGLQLRLVCNLLDGMLAVEGGLKSRTGELYNELPDRVSDTVVFLALGYGCRWGWGPGLGWSAAILALGTAYVRVLGAAAGAPHLFLGPMAKQHRMAILTAALLGAAILPSLGPVLLRGALVVLVLGTGITVVRRVRAVAERLEGEPSPEV
jgi:phosphatidylglycerophosphate synthase